MPQLRNCCFTWNNYEDLDEILGKLQAWKAISYAVIGEEVGKQGTPHLQGYLEFKYSIRVDKIKAMMPPSHFEGHIKDQEFERTRVTADV